MIIQPIQPNQPSMQMKYHNKTYIDDAITKRVRNYITLDNNKQIAIETEYVRDRMTSKLISLKDELGKWVKSKLTYYNYRGKKAIVRRSERKDYEN